MVRNIFPTPIEKSRLDLNGLFEDVVDNDESIGVDAPLIDNDFTTPPLVPSKRKSKADRIPHLKREVESLKKCMMESDFKIFNIIEVLIKKVDKHNALEHQDEEYRCRGLNIDHDNEYHDNNVNHDQNVTIHLDNIQTMNEDPTNRANDNSDSVNEGASMKSVVYRFHPFGSFNMDDNCNKGMDEFREWMDEGRRARNKKYPYAKKDNILNSLFEFRKMTISKKDWFHKLAYGGQALEKLLRKKEMFDDVPVKLTKNDGLFDLNIKTLYKNFIENNGDSDVVKMKHDISKYILGEWLLCGSPWHTVDHLLFPLYVDGQWIMARLTIKERSLFVYDLIGDAAFRANVRSVIDAYKFIIPLFLSKLNFFF
ncbi:hypothetical protein T459_27887 [Capsicum annuum]|uniref:Ubiquitin-like protease family profile domain-containing protein n=1 Tax=Capsicum annuum TaxID=4072 RepID=A0A2G2YF99_CAPAN|nr:hypothetical protein T459_27887 [Capsicum annuum]